MNDKKAKLYDAVTILKRLESLLLIAQDSAERGAVDATVIADVLEIMHGMTGEAENLLIQLKEIA